MERRQWETRTGWRMAAAAMVDDGRSMVDCRFRIRGVEVDCGRCLGGSMHAPDKSHPACHVEVILSIAPE